MGTTTFPSEGRHGEENVLPAPCFSDVLEAQRWAVQVVRHAEEEACRRGMRGSPAWEDAWRDALWTLAVQKRCVEVEARKCCAAKRPADVPPPPPGLPPDVEAIAALREQTALEMRYLETRKRVDGLEERLQLLSQQLEALLDSHAVVPTSAEATAVHVALQPGSGPLPAGLSSPVRSARGAAPRRAGRVPSPPPGAAPELSGLSFLSDDRDERIEELQRQLQRAEAERIDASHRLVSLEGELAMLQESLRSSEVKLRESYRKLEETESTWRQRHSALQRQLQRTERQLSVSAAL